MATKKKPTPALSPIFDTKKVKAPEPEGYDQWVPRRLKEASDTKLRCLIVWADYCYWVKNDSIMSDFTFDLLVREYTCRCPDDTDFLDKIGMW
jgi:hypothetical protein